MNETKKCPYCGEEILAVAKKCKHCGEWLEEIEPEKKKISDKGTVQLTLQESYSSKIETKPAENEGYKSNVTLALGAVVLGSILSFANDFAQLYPSDTGGFFGQIVALGLISPSWIAVLLDGCGSTFLLWRTADSIRNHIITERQDDDASYLLLLKAVSILYCLNGLIFCFAEEGLFYWIAIVLTIIMVLLMTINGFLLKKEKNPLIASIGGALLVNVLIFIFMIKFLFITNYNSSFYLCFLFLENVAWICTMTAAFLFVQKNSSTK